MDATAFYNKAKELFPLAVEISVSCSKQGGNDRAFVGYCVLVYDTPIGGGVQPYAYGYDYTPEDALAAAVAYAARAVEPLDMAALAGNILGVNKAA